MPIVGELPDTGVRVILERARGLGPPWRYLGEAATAKGRFAMAATVGADGQVVVELPGDAPPGLSGKARLIVRSAYKHGLEAAEPPRRIARWRADP